MKVLAITHKDTDWLYCKY